jgi:hypothetical protein
MTGVPIPGTGDDSKLSSPSSKEHQCFPCQIGFDNEINLKRHIGQKHRSKQQVVAIFQNNILIKLLALFKSSLLLKSY